MFHVSMFEKYVHDSNHIILNFRDMKIPLNASYLEEVIRILDRHENLLCTNTVSLVKVLRNMLLDI